MNTPLTDLEMVELIWACYPDDYTGDESDEDWNKALDFVDQLEGFDDIADLLGRIVMLTPTVDSMLSNKTFHVLGKQQGDSFVAIVKRLLPSN